MSASSRVANRIGILFSEQGGYDLTLQKLAPAPYAQRTLFDAIEGDPTVDYPTSLIV